MQRRFDGQVEEITAARLRLMRGAIIDSVREGKTFVITKNGWPIAVLCPIHGSRVQITTNEEGKRSYALV
jgi:prevent-host-death family protein